MALVKCRMRDCETNIITELKMRERSDRKLTDINLDVDYRSER